MDLAEYRNEFLKNSLDLKDLAKNPFAQFENWFQSVLSAKISEPNAMSIATVSADGQPSLRTVLLKYFDEKGLVFFTNYESRKAQEIKENPKVALLFFWKEMERQVKICGYTESVSRMETMKYFMTRPRESQIGAWVSKQSQVVSTKTLLHQKMAAMKKKFQSGVIPVPNFWGGYRVVPLSFEFWQGGKNRLHDRFIYESTENGNWNIKRLSP